MFVGVVAALAGWISGSLPQGAGARDRRPYPGTNGRVSALEAEVARLAEQFGNVSALQPLEELEGDLYHHSA